MSQRNKSIGLLAGLVVLSVLLLFPCQVWAEQSTGTIDIRVDAEADDAEESGGSVNTSIYDLELGDKICGIRFQDLQIPQGSSITSAYIQFAVDEVRNNDTDLTIWGQGHEDPLVFANSDFNISNRAKTTASVSWNDVPEWGNIGETGVAQQSPDLSAIVQEIVDLSYWSSGNAIVFIFEGSGERVAEARKSGYDTAPLLHVEYTTDAVERRIIQEDDDAEERGDNNGEMALYSSDLDFVQDRLIGLRFQDITVPRGAEITRAYIELRVDETDSNDSDIRIDVELHDAALAFSISNDNISNRTLSGNYIRWDPVPQFDTIHETQRTPDLTTLVQQIVGRSGWVSGNSMVFVLEGRQGDRVTESYDGADDHGNLSLAPMLHIEYGEGQIGTDEPIITVDTNSIGASVYEGSSPDDDDFTITNTGTGELEYQISDDADWLTLSSTSGDVEDGESTDITVTLNTTALSVGIHETTITVTDPDALNNPVEIQVSVTILQLPEDMTCGNLPVYTQNLVSPAILILLDISGSMDDMMDVSPQEKPQTPDLKNIVQEIIDRPGWDDGNAMGFIIEGTGKRVAKSYNGSTSQAALLHVAYTKDAGDHTVEIRVSQGDDDAEENQSGTYVSLGSSDLEMVNDGYRGNQTIGIRFQNVTIPPGATINNAYIEFTIDESDSGDTDLTIYGEDMDNPPTFANVADNISGRTKTTASAVWNGIEEWSGVTQEMRIDIAKSVISDLVKDRAISWGFGTWCNSDPWDDRSDYTIIHEGTKQNTDEHQAALQSAIDSPDPHGGTPFSFSIEAATNYFEGTKDDETGSSYLSSDCQPKFLIEITDGMGNTGSTSQNTRSRTEALAAAEVTGIGVGFGLDYDDSEQLYVMADVANDKGDDSDNDDLYALHEEINDVAEPFFAYNKQELIDALNTIAESVKGAVFHGSAPAPTTSVDLGDMVIVAQFDASRWIGDVNAVTKADNGLWVNKVWTASEALPASREVWTITDPDNPATVTPYDESTLTNDNFQCVTDKPIGDVINSTPVVIGYPPFWYPFDGYMNFARNMDREPMIYVGANDGFLHTFRLSDGVEQWSFMPQNLHAKLDNADDPLYDRCASEYCHQYYVDGNPIAADVYADFNGDTNKEWRTMLVAGEREGGQAYFALDITSGLPFDDADPTKYLWQFADEQLGETWSDPAIERVAIKDVSPSTETAWGAYMGSGYFPIPDQQASKTAYLYGIIAHDASDLWQDVGGSPINRIPMAPNLTANITNWNETNNPFAVGEIITGLDSGAYGQILSITNKNGAADNRTATLELTDVAGNFITGETIDGDISGQAKIDGNPVAGTGSLVNDALSSPLAVDMEGDFISDRIYVGNLYGNMYRVTNIGKNMTPEVTTLFSFGNSSPNENPIRAKANYGFGSTDGDVWIYFGSGRYESQADKQDDHQQYFLGLKDSIISEAPYTLSDLVSLQAKFATTTIEGASVSVRVIEGSNSLALPWKLQLYEKTFSDGPAASGTERVVSQPLVVGGLVIFTSFIPDEDICAGSGETWVFAVDFKSGLAPTTPIFDLNGDKLFNEDDKVEINGEKVVPVGIYVGRGKGSKPVLHKNILFITTTGDGVVALGDDTNSGQEFFAQKINIKNQTVRLEAWRHK